MAIGAALLFGVRLPVNFASPYKARSIIEFWRRWHMTLSRFLRDYLYIPLGGNRKGRFRRYVNLFITMILGGFWHGAGWTFVIWGGLHGVYLAVNNGWRALLGRVWPSGAPLAPLGRGLSRVITFLAVVAGWVFFRAADVHTALRMLRAMAGGGGLAVPESLATVAPHLTRASGPVDSGKALAVALLFLGIAWLGPNTQQLTAYVPPVSTSATYSGAEVSRRPRWRPSMRWALATGCLFAVCLMFLSKVSEFIYFQF
jgi:alginate O-acetyltransferase complex protein AlgI